MKKTLAILSMVVFLGAMGAPAFAMNNATSQSIELADDDPKKKKTKKTEKKACSDAKAEESDCCSKKSCDTESKKK